MTAETGERVQLYVYDLSQGLAKQLSPILLNKQIDGIWHTSVVVGGCEYYYGGGINQATPGQTPFGPPLYMEELGETHIPKEIRDEYLEEMTSKYTAASYNLFTNNCNNFSDEFATFLTGRGIPAHITGLPQEVLATPLGQMIAPMLSGLEQRLANVHQEQAFQPAVTLQDAVGAASSISAVASAAASTGASANPAGVSKPTVTGEAEASTSSAAPSAGKSGQPAEGSDPQSSATKQTQSAASPRLVQAATAGGPADRTATRQDGAGSATHETAADIAAGVENVAEAIAASSKADSESGAATAQQQQSSAAAQVAADPVKAAFEAAVRAEFSRIMQAGAAASANEAALQAVRIVAEKAGQAVQG
jgi:hypothetical protein